MNNAKNRIPNSGIPTTWKSEHRRIGASALQRMVCWHIVRRRIFTDEPAKIIVQSALCFMWYVGLGVIMAMRKRAVTKKTAGFLGFYPLPAAMRSVKHGVG